MSGLINRIIKKLTNSKPVDQVGEMVKEGVIKTGKGCKLDGLNVLVVNKKPGEVNIEMGDNCCLLGTIIVYRQTAKVKFGSNVYMGPGTLLECVEEIEIGSDVLISGNCNIIDTNSHSLHSSDRVHDTIDWQKGLEHKNWDVVESQKVVIKPNCWVGVKSIVLKGVTLEQGTIVGAGSVVTKNTERFTLVAGNPARFIKNVD